jgi:hypothetical protein
MKDNDPYGCGCAIYTMILVVVLVILVASVCVIGTSDLPEWFKFWLLK